MDQERVGQQRARPFASKNAALGTSGRNESCAHWRASHFLKIANKLVEEYPLLRSVRTASDTFEEHMARIIQRWG